MMMIDDKTNKIETDVYDNSNSHDIRIIHKEYYLQIILLFFSGYWTDWWTLFLSLSPENYSILTLQ